MPRRRVNRPALREGIVYLSRHENEYALTSTARRNLLRYLPGGDANRRIEEVRRGHYGQGTFRLEGRLNGTTRRIVWVRIVSTRRDARAPAPVTYASAAEVTLAAQAPAPGRDVARHADLVAIAQQVRDHTAVLKELVPMVRGLLERVRTLEAKETTRAACDLAAQRARRLGLP